MTSMRIISILIISAFAPSVLLASTEQMEIISVTASRQAQPIKNQTISSSVIDQSQIERISPEHIENIVNNLPGVNINKGNGQEYLPAIRSGTLTGGAGCGSVVAALDGVPLRSAAFCNINELFEVPFESAQRVEVIRGPATAFFGANALNGVVNVISPSAASFDGSTVENNKVAFQYGSDDFNKLQLSNSVHVNDSNAVRADIALTDSGSFRAESGYEQQKVLLKHGYSDDSLKINSTFLLTNLNQETAGYITGKDAYKDKKLITTNANPEAYRDAKSIRLQSTITHYSDNTEQWQITPYFRYVDMDFLQHFLPGDPLEQNQHTSIGIQSFFNGYISDSLTTLWGIDSEFTQGTLVQTQDKPTQGSNFLIATIPVGKHYDYSVDNFVISTFGRLVWQPYEQLSVNADIRLEYSGFDYDNKMLSGRTREDGTDCGYGGCRYSRPESDKDHFLNLSPKLGVLYTPTVNSTFFANLSHAFRPPQATELYRLQREQAKADLDSVEQVGAEFGWRYQLGRFYFEVTNYYSKKYNEIYRDSAYYNVSNGKSKSVGTEIVTRWNISDTWYLDANLALSKNTYLDKRENNGEFIYGNDVDSSPRRYGGLSLTWQALDNLNLTTSCRYIGKYFTDPENQHTYNGHTVCNLYSALMVNEQVSLNFKINNLTDTRYADRADFTTFSGDRYFPGAPRCVYLSLQFDY